MTARQDNTFFSNKPNIRRQQMMAQRLMEQGKQPQNTEMVSGYAVQQSPVAGLARALTQGLGGYMEGQATQAEMDRQKAARETMAQAIDAYSRSQSGGQTQLADGETINWNVTPPDRAGQMYANILMGNEDTADMGMQSVMGQMQAKQNMANELDMYRQKFPMELELARQRAAIEAQYRAPPAAPASYQEFILAQQNPDFAAWKNKQQIDPITGEPVRKLSATEQKEVFDIQEKSDATGGAISALQRAKEILGRGGEGYNEAVDGAQPYTGMGADARTAAARIPIIGGLIADKERAAATTEAKNLVTEQALGSMKAIFGGNPTEGERNILLQLQALPTYTPAEQNVIIDNAIKAAERRQSNFTQRLNQIGTGQYFTQQNLDNPYATPNPAINTPVDQIPPALSVPEQGSSTQTSFATLEDAEAANLPPGTVITIGGRRAVIE
jgi:hypothetical protein